jgi:AraC-like DNA-binding protein
LEISAKKGHIFPDIRLFLETNIDLRVEHLGHRSPAVAPPFRLLKRLTEARRLLAERACDSIAQVASKVGYNDARPFSRSFRARFRILPSEVL